MTPSITSGAGAGELSFVDGANEMVVVRAGVAGLGDGAKETVVVCAGVSGLVDGAKEKAGVAGLSPNGMVLVVGVLLATVPNGAPAGVAGRPDPNCMAEFPNTGFWLPPKTLVAGAPNEPNIAASVK